MKLDFIPLLISFAVLSCIAGVNSQGKPRKAPLEGSGSGLGPGVDDEDRGSQLPAGGSLLKKPPKKKAPRRPPISPSDRNRWTSPQAPTSRSSGGGGVLPESGRWPASKTRNPPYRAAPTPRQQLQQPQQPQQPQQQQQQQPAANLSPQLPQQGDEGSGAGGAGGGGGGLGGEAPPDQERAPQRSKLPPRARPEMLPAGPRKSPQLTEMPIPCKEAQRRGRRLHYYPRCDAAGRYERRQCNKDDCMCVSPDTGIVLEKTVALREKNISCDEVRYLIQLPLRRSLGPYDDHAVIQSKVLALLESLLDNLPGQQRLEFQRYLPNRSSPISGLEVLCRSVGHSDPSALARFLTTHASKGSLPIVSATRSVNVTRLTSAPVGGLDRSVAADRLVLAGRRLLSIEADNQRDYRAVKDTSSLGNSAREQFNAAKDTPADETDPNAPRNDESQAGPRKKKSGAAAFLQQPGVIAAIIGGGIAGFFLAILLILFCIYRIRKKDEGSYALEEPKKMPVSAAVYHSAPTREYYA